MRMGQKDRQTQPKNIIPLTMAITGAEANNFLNVLVLRLCMSYSEPLQEPDTSKQLTQNEAFLENVKYLCNCIQRPEEQYMDRQRACAHLQMGLFCFVFFDEVVSCFCFRHSAPFDILHTLSKYPSCLLFVPAIF